MMGDMPKKFDKENLSNIDNEDMGIQS